MVKYKQSVAQRRLYPFVVGLIDYDLCNGIQVERERRGKRNPGAIILQYMQLPARSKIGNPEIVIRIKTKPRNPVVARIAYGFLQRRILFKYLYFITRPDM